MTMITKIKFLVASLILMATMLCPNSAMADGWKNDWSQCSLKYGENTSLSIYGQMFTFTPTESGKYCFDITGFSFYCLQFSTSESGEDNETTTANSSPVELKADTKYYFEIVGGKLSDENSQIATITISKYKAQDRYELKAFYANLGGKTRYLTNSGLLVTKDDGESYVNALFWHNPSNGYLIDYSTGKYITVENDDLVLSLTPQDMTDNLSIFTEEVYPGNIIPVTKVGDKYYATYYSPVCSKLPECAKAYYPHLDSKSGDIIIDDKYCSQIVNPYTGVIIVADYDEDVYFDDTHILAEISKDTLKTNCTSDLTGSIATITNPGDALVLGLNSSSEIGFYGYSGTTLTGTKAYFDNSDGKLNGARLRFVSSDDEEAAAIANLLGVEVADDAPAYTITGQRATAGYKGIVIKNGKKVMK